MALSSYRSATSRHDAPASIASITRTRKSLEYGASASIAPQNRINAARLARRQTLGNPPDSIRAKYALDRPSRRNQFPEFLSILNAMDSDFHLAVRPHLSAMPTLGFQSNGRGRVRRSRSNVTQDYDRFGDGCRSHRGTDR